MFKVWNKLSAMWRSANRVGSLEREWRCRLGGLARVLKEGGVTREHMVPGHCWGRQVLVPHRERSARRRRGHPHFFYPVPRLPREGKTFARTV